MRSGRFQGGASKNKPHLSNAEQRELSIKSKTNFSSCLVNRAIPDLNSLERVEKFASRMAHQLRLSPNYF